MTNMIYCECSLASLYPDGSVRCILDMSMANKKDKINCPHIHSGSPKLARLEDLLKERNKPSEYGRKGKLVREKEKTVVHTEKREILGEDIDIATVELTPETKASLEREKKARQIKAKAKVKKDSKIDPRQGTMF